LKEDANYDVTVNVEGVVPRVRRKQSVRHCKSFGKYQYRKPPALRKEGLLTRDSRMVERKKPAAKGTQEVQFSKR